MNTIFAKYNQFIFDLDNTLISEIQYLEQGYLRISKFIAKEYLKSTKEVHKFMIKTFESEGRELLFQKLMNKFDLPANLDIGIFKNLLANVILDKKLNLINNTDQILRKLQKTPEMNVFILTNGNPVQQRNKVNQTKWPDNFQFTEIVYANTIAPKPSPKALNYLIERQKLNRGKVLFIGDSASDEECAESAKISFCHIHQFERSFFASVK